MVLVLLCPSATLQNNNYNCVESTTSLIFFISKHWKIGQFFQTEQNYYLQIMGIFFFFFLKLSRTTVLKAPYKSKPAKSCLKRGMVCGEEVGHLQGNVKCDVSDMHWSEKVAIRGSTVVALQSAGEVALD